MSKTKIVHTNMKIKLVTFAPHPNFGTCLQSYALNYVLRKMGNDVEFLYNRREVEPLSQFTYMKIFVKRIMKALWHFYIIQLLQHFQN